MILAYRINISLNQHYQWALWPNRTDGFAVAYSTVYKVENVTEN